MPPGEVSEGVAFDWHLRASDPSNSVAKLLWILHGRFRGHAANLRSLAPQQRRYSNLDDGTLMNGSSKRPIQLRGGLRR